MHSSIKEFKSLGSLKLLILRYSGRIAPLETFAVAVPALALHVAMGGRHLSRSGFSICIASTLSDASQICQ